MGSRRFARFLLWLNAAVWLGFGLGYTIAPAQLAALAGAEVSSVDSYRIMTDVGVMMVGIAGWYLYCALDEARIDLGLISALMIAAGLLAGRLIGIAVTGSAPGVVLAYAGLEALDVALLAISVRTRAAQRRAVVATG